MSQSLEINNMRRSGLKWRLSAMYIAPGEYGATLQLRGYMLNPAAMARLIALNLREVARELRHGDQSGGSLRDDQA